MIVGLFCHSISNAGTDRRVRGGSKGMVRSVAALCEAAARVGKGGAAAGRGVDREGCGALHLAAKEGFDGVVAVLLEWRDRLGFDPDRRDKQGMTALVRALALPHA
jgi:hypothetical protein